MKRTIIFSLLLLVLAVEADAQTLDTKTPADVLRRLDALEARIADTWAWVDAGEETSPAIPVLVSYKIKEAFGARMNNGSVIIHTKAMYENAHPGQLLDDLLLALAKRGELAKVKRLDRPREASISILSYQIVREDIIFTTEQLHP